ncbi:MAG: hypothetical protein V4850_14600 [Myxococcota bacterium]
MTAALLALFACADQIDTPDVDTGAPDPAAGPDWVVDCQGGGDFRTVQAAIDAATSGDSIALQPCTYPERIDYSAKVLDIYGVEGSAVTFLDGESGGTVVRVVSGESLDTRLAGVTIQGGQNAGQGSAIMVYQSSLHLEDVVLTGNGEAFAVLYAGDAVVTADGLTIAANATSADGMAIYSSGGGLTLDHASVDCDGGLYGIYQHNAATIDHSSFRCGGGVAFYSHHGELRARRSSFVGGTAGLLAEESSPDDTSQRVLLSNIFASGATALDIRHLTMELTNSVLAGANVGLNLVSVNPYSFLWNSIVLNSACGVQGDGGSLTVYYTNFWNNTADTCSVTADVPYAADPLFINFPDDLTLGAGSPMIDAGEPTWFDLDGSRSDVGVFGGPGGSW